MRRDVYSGTLKLKGEEDADTLLAVLNYASVLGHLGRFEEARSLLRPTIPVARRVLGENDETTLKMRWGYARALSEDHGASLDSIHEAVTTLEDMARTMRRVLGGAHPLSKFIQMSLQHARATLRAREETPSVGA